MKFKEKINEIFDYGIERYSESEADKTVNFEVDGSDFTAEQLFKLSDLLGTGTIRTYAETREGGYCETCSFSYSVMVFEATDVKFS